MRGLKATEIDALQHTLLRVGRPCDAECLEDGSAADGEAHFGVEIWDRLLERGLISLHDCKLRDDIEHIEVTKLGHLAMRLARAS